MHFNQDDINTGERLRGIRESMKMNREEFSEKIDITDSFLGQIERGERALSVKTLRKVVKYTGVSADYLLFGKDTNNETIQKINNILTVNSAETSDFIYHIVMYSNDFCKKLNKELKDLPYGFGAAIGYSMIMDDIKTIDDAINEATLEMKTVKEELK